MSSEKPAPHVAPPKIKVAFESVVWGPRIDDLDYMLSVLQACGYQGVEIAQCPSNIFVYENDATVPIGGIEVLVARCEKHHLQLIGLVGGSLEDRVKYIEDRRDIALYLDDWPEHAWNYLVQPNPIRLAIHPHWFMPIRRRKHFEEKIAEARAQVLAHYRKSESTKDKAQELTENACANLRLIVDTAHSFIAEDDPEKFVRDHFESLESVHLKGWRPDFGRWSHRYPKGFCIPDKGIVDVASVMDALTELNYDGWVVIEQDHFAQSRERTAEDCAAWLAGNVKKWPVEIKIDSSKLRLLEIQRPSNPFREATGSLSAIELAKAFSANPCSTPESYYHNVVSTLNKLLRPEFVKLWSYNPSTRSFYLLAATDSFEGLVDCENRLPENGSLAGQVAVTPVVGVYDLEDAKIREKILDQDFLDQVQSKWMICVPIFNAFNAHHLRGMFTLFTDHAYDDKDIKRLEMLAHVTALWADYIGGEVCAAAAGATNYLCGEVESGVVTFVDALWAHLIEMFDCEHVSIFLRDAARTRLEPIGKCVQYIKWKEGTAKHNEHYKLGEGLTGRVWAEQEMLFSDYAPASPGHAGKSKESPTNKREEILFAPLARLNGEVLGVIRLRNKRPHSNSSGSTMFTDDDAAKLDAIIQSALPHLELLLTQRHQASSLVRLNHELQNPLVGILGAVDALRIKLKARGFIDLKAEFGADYLDDVLSYRELMSRLALNTQLFGESFDRLKPEFDRFDMATAIVEPVARQLGPLVRRYNLPQDRIKIAIFQGIIPWLWVDRLMMQQVFFNLLVNAIKYRDTGNRDSFSVTIEVDKIEQDGDPTWYQLDVVDWGVGLDDDEEAAERMFIAGVRGSDAAKRHDPGGTGIGLSVVREIVELHGGTVEFMPNRDERTPWTTAATGFGSKNLYKKPTRVRIRLPASLRHGKPKVIVHHPLAANSA